jgi:cobalt-zinc-cadmium efflux system protein
MTHNRFRTPVSGRKLAGAILFNLAISVAELIGGLVSGYLALTADAVHNLSDVAALGLAWLGVKGAQLPATKKSTYGYRRLEVMTAFVSAVSLVVIAVFILIEAYGRLVSPQPITQPVLFLTVAVIGLAGNIFSMWLLDSEKGKSLNMKTAFLHMAYDTVSSTAVIGGGIIILITDWLVIDALLSAVIALMIFWSSYLVMKEAVMVFLEAVPAGIDFDTVLEAVKKVEPVKGVHDLHIWSLSSQVSALSCHVCLDTRDYPNGPEIIARINGMLKERFNIDHGTIQLETESCDRPDVLCRTGDASREKS